MILYRFAGEFLPPAFKSSNSPFSGRAPLVILRDGSFDSDGVESVRQPFAIEASFDVTDWCANNTDDKLDELMAVFAAGRRVLVARQLDGITERQTFAKVVSVDRPATLSTKEVQPLTVTFSVDYPYWMSTDDEPYYLNNGKVLSGWPLAGYYEAEVIATTSHSFIIANSGTSQVRRGRINFVPRAGASITNPKITNSRTGEWIRYVGVTAFNNQLNLRLLDKSCKINWITDAYSGMQINTGQMDWLTLALGDNPIIVTCSAITGTVDLEWHWSRQYS